MSNQRSPFDFDSYIVDAQIYWRTGWRREWIQIVDTLASRYGWTIEYIETLELDFIMALMHQVAIKPHFMYVNEELLKEDEADLKIDEDKEEMVQVAQQPYSWQPKTVDRGYTETEQYERAKLVNMMRSAGVPKEKIKKQIARITPEVMAIHREIDKHVAIITGGSRTTGKEKYEARVKISDLVKRLYKLGVVVPIGGGK